MAVAAVLHISNDMVFILPVTIVCAILLLRTGQNTKIKGDAAVAMISVGALAIGYLLMNIFSTGPNLSGDVCTTLFGSTSILTLGESEVWICAVLAGLILAGCGQNSANRVTTENAVVSAIQDQVDAADEKTTAVTMETTAEMSSETEETTTELTTEEITAAPAYVEEPTTEEMIAEQADAEEAAATKTVDYDLTSMNADMVYATVYQLMIDPDTYTGKTVRMGGSFIAWEDAQTGNTYYACLIEDALACCRQGMEFVWGDGSHSYPDEYPEQNAQITVTGTFDTYKEGNFRYCRLVNADLKVEP